MNIYLDNAATTPILPEVLSSMLPFLENNYGNPASLHKFGQITKSAIENARDIIAKALGAKSSEIIFANSGTESINWAFLGLINWLKKNNKTTILTTRSEHRSILDMCKYLEVNHGFEIAFLDLNNHGIINLDQLNSLAISAGLITIHHANSETGTIQPVKEIGAIAKESGSIYHIDAIQSFAVEKIDVEELKVDLLSIASHKVHGPKGASSLFINENLMTKQIWKQPFYSGTINTPSIVGFGKAVEILEGQKENFRNHVRNIKEHFIQALKKEKLNFVINGDLENTLPTILNLSFRDKESKFMMIRLDLEGVSCSIGSACSSGSIKDSHVLTAMGLEKCVIKGALRFSFSHLTTIEDINVAVNAIKKICF